jgi:hypothetical protein
MCNIENQLSQAVSNVTRLCLQNEIVYIDEETVLPDELIEPVKRLGLALTDYRKKYGSTLFSYYIPVQVGEISKSRTLYVLDDPYYNDDEQLRVDFEINAALEVDRVCIG